MCSEFLAFVVAMPLPSEFLLKASKGFLDVGTDAIDFQYLMLGELCCVGVEVEVTPAEYLDQEA
jgi:hypothetical protein